MEENWTAGRDKGGTPADLLGGMDRTTLLDKSELNDGWPGGLDDGCATGWERGGLKGRREVDDGCLLGGTTAALLAGWERIGLLGGSRGATAALLYERGLRCWVGQRWATFTLLDGGGGRQLPWLVDNGCAATGWKNRRTAAALLGRKEDTGQLHAR